MATAAAKANAKMKAKPKSEMRWYIERGNGTDAYPHWWQPCHDNLNNKFMEAFGRGDAHLEYTYKKHKYEADLVKRVVRRQGEGQEKGFLLMQAASTPSHR